MIKMKTLQKMYLLYPHVYEKMYSKIKDSVNPQVSNGTKIPQKTKFKKKPQYVKKNNVGEWMKTFQAVLKEKHQTRKRIDRTRILENLIDMFGKQKQPQFSMSTKPTDTSTQTPHNYMKNEPQLPTAAPKLPFYTNSQYNTEDTLIHESDHSDSNDVFESVDEEEEALGPSSNTRSRTGVSRKSSINTRSLTQKGKGVLNWTSI